MQITESFEVAIKAHQAPAVTDGQRCKLGIGAKPG